MSGPSGPSDVRPSDVRPSDVRFFRPCPSELTTLDSIAPKGMSCEAGSGQSTKGRGQEAGEEEKAEEEVGSSLLLLVFYMYDRLGSELAVGR